LFGRRVLPTFGARALNSLRRGELEAWTARPPLARQTANQAAQYLSTMLESAVADGLIATNPARGAKRPRVDREPVVPFIDAEIEALRAAAPEWFAVALTLGLGVGLRQSEATGLRLDRIDFLRREPTIDRPLISPKAGRPHHGPPKSARSYRTVPLADGVVEALAHHVEVHGIGQDGLVLHLRDGRPIRRQQFGRLWHQTRTPSRPTGGPGSTTCGTPTPACCSRAGCRWRRRPNYLGHSPAMLLATYAHLLPVDHERARSAIETAFAGSSRVTAVSGG
jgi:integrase